MGAPMTPVPIQAIRIAGESNVPTMRLRALIDDYYDACNSADADRLRAKFTDGATHYFTRLPSVHGNDKIADTFATMADKLQATWTVEHCLESGDEAVIEWTMRWTPVGGSEEFIDRGTEWYIFEDDLIAEIRAYHHSDEKNRSGDLLGFDHAGRGHTVLA